MYKKIIIAIITIIIIITGVVIFIFANKKENINNNEIYANNKQDQIEQLNTVTEENEETKSEKTFWINSVQLPEQNLNANFRLYNDKISLPIKLENLDICSAPYSFWPNGTNQTNANTIQEILASKTKINSKSETKVVTQTKFLDGSWKDYDEVPDNIGDILINNYNDNSTTIEECYNNGWWYILNQYDLDDIFGIDISNNSEYHKEWYEIPVVEKIIDKIGGPTYIRMNKTSSENLNTNQGIISYDLVYEYNEFTFIIPIMEMITNGNDNLVTKCSGMIYYTKQSWEKEKNETVDEYYIINK